MKETRVTINISQPPEVSTLDIAAQVAHAIKGSDLGATVNQTYGIWEDVLEPGSEIVLIYPAEQAWKAGMPCGPNWPVIGLSATLDVLFALHEIVPKERLFQVVTDSVDLREWNAQEGRFTDV